MEDRSAAIAELNDLDIATAFECIKLFYHPETGITSMDINFYARIHCIEDIEKFLHLVKVGERTLREEVSSQNKNKKPIGSGITN